VLSTHGPNTGPFDEMRRMESTIPTTVNRLCPTAKGSMHRTLTGANGALAEISGSNAGKNIYNIYRFVQIMLKIYEKSKLNLVKI